MRGPDCLVPPGRERYRTALVSEAKPPNRAPVAPASVLRASVPEGTIPVAVALLIAGVATYAFFKVGTKAVGKEQFKPLTALWFTTFALAPGFFLPLEQELGRALGHRRALGQGGGPVVAKVVRLGLLLGGVVALVIAVASPLIANGLFEGNWVMVAALILAFASYAPMHLARGICSGSGRFRAYAIVMGCDGIVRISLCLLLLGLGVTAVGAYGIAVALSPLVGIVIIWSRGSLRTEPGPPATWAEVTPNLGWLLLGSVFAAGLLNAGPILTGLFAANTEEARIQVVDFGYGVLLARIPLFMFQAVQAALLPRLSRLAAAGNYAEFRAGLKRLMILVGAVGVVGSIGALGLGPFVLERVYDGAQLSGTTLAMLAAGSAGYMVALALAQAVIALKGHAFVAVGWLLATVGLLLGTWLGSDDVFRRVEIGLVVSSLTAIAYFGFVLRQRLASGVRPDSDSMLEAITDMPLES